MKPQNSKAISIALTLLTLAGSAWGETWSRSYVIEYYEPTHYCGGTMLARDQPGTDCRRDGCSESTT